VCCVVVTVVERTRRGREGLMCKKVRSKVDFGCSFDQQQRRRGCHRHSSQIGVVDDATRLEVR
jgi:hypothetical protein